MSKKRDIIETKRLVLRAYELCDEEQMVEILLNEDIKKTFMIPDFSDRNQAKELFGKLMEFSRSDQHFEYGVYLCDKLIGFVNDCGMDDATIEIGYVIHPDYQGNGYATEAVKNCIEELFIMGYNQVRAGFFEENQASKRVMEKCGMKKIDLEEDIEYQGKVHHCIYYNIEREPYDFTSCRHTKRHYR